MTSDVNINVSTVGSEKQLRRRKFIRAISIALIPIVTASLLWSKFQIVFDSTGSIEGNVFFVVVEDQPKLRQWDIVVFYPPANPHYKKRTKFIKYVAAFPGDFITENDRDYYLDDYFLGKAKTHSLTGIPLQKNEAGIVPVGHVFVHSPHKDAFDSRYQAIGFIPYENILGKAYRIL